MNLPFFFFFFMTPDRAPTILFLHVYYISRKFFFHFLQGISAFLRSNGQGTKWQLFCSFIKFLIYRKLDWESSVLGIKRPYGSREALLKVT